MKPRSYGALSAAILLAGLWIDPQGAAARPRGYEGHQVVRVEIRTDAQLATLRRLAQAGPDVEIWSDGVGVGWVDVRVSPGRMGALKAAALSYRVQIPDLQRYFDEAFAGTLGGDFFDYYRTHDEHMAFLGDLAGTYADLAEVVEIGRSVQGRPLVAIRIAGPGFYKPGVLFLAAQHGNELTGPAVVAYMARHLLTQYDDDVWVRRLVDDVEWFLLPIANPDGYAHGTRSNARNVDLNRNWDGPQANANPFSEPETAALRDFLDDHPKVRAFIDFHTYGKMIMWPWGHTEVRCQDHDTYDLLGRMIHDRIAQTRGTRYDRLGPIFTTIYPVRGASIDYTYSRLGLWSFTLELGCCAPAVPVSDIVPTAAEIAPAMALLAEWVSDCNANGVPDRTDIALGHAEDCDGNGTPDGCERQRDFDGDALADVCDPDIDNDGVPNDADACPFTLTGVPTDAAGRPIGDGNGNCNVEVLDYRQLRLCIRDGGPSVAAVSSECRTAFDYNTDGVIDLSDYAGFAASFTGFRQALPQ